MEVLRIAMSTVPVRAVERRWRTGPMGYQGARPQPKGAPKGGSLAAGLLPPGR